MYKKSAFSSSCPKLSRNVCLMVVAVCLPAIAGAGTSAVPGPRALAPAGSAAAPTLPGQQLPSQLSEEPHYAGKRSVMKAGMNNLKAGSILREQNKLDPSIVTTRSGLQYRIREAGTGASPKKGDTVEVYYQGKLVDNTVFDAVERPMKPARIAMAQAMRGWREALRKMAPGAKWQLFVPPELGYGATGLPPLVGPSATLIYELELVSVKSGGNKTSRPTGVSTSMPEESPGEPAGPDQQ